MHTNPRHRANIRSTYVKTRSDSAGSTRDTSASEHLVQLIAKSALRDHDAFRDLYQRTSGLLFRLVMQRLRETARAEDVLQDAFVEIWNKAGTYSPSLSKPMTWLMMIVNNRAIDEVRRRAREGRIRVFEDEESANRSDEPHQHSAPMDGFRD